MSRNNALLEWKINAMTIEIEGSRFLILDFGYLELEIGKIIEN